MFWILCDPSSGSTELLLAEITHGDSQIFCHVFGSVITVHPVPTPLSTVLLVSNNVRDGGSSQNLMLFIRGNAMSGAPSINGTNQFPNPPIMISITMKKIITKAWAVTMTL
jgi:hypothetical protein